MDVRWSQDPAGPAEDGTRAVDFAASLAGTPHGGVPLLEFDDRGRVVCEVVPAKQKWTRTIYHFD